MTGCDEIITTMDSVITKKTISTKIRSTVSINCHSIEVKYCHIKYCYFAHSSISNHITIDN